MESKLHIDSVHWDKVVVSWCDDKTKMGRNYSIHLEEKAMISSNHDYYAFTFKIVNSHLPVKYLTEEILLHGQILQEIDC